MLLLDELLARRGDRHRAKSLALSEIEAHGERAEAHLTACLPSVRSWRDRLVIRLAIDEVNWRFSKEWLPDFPEPEQNATPLRIDGNAPRPLRPIVG